MKYPRSTILLFCALFAAVALSALHVAAQERAVDLELFIVEPTADDEMELFFETGSEDSTLEFFFLRGSSLDDPALLNPDPNNPIEVMYEGNIVTAIPAEGNAGSGATYDAFDLNVEDGETYCYMIGERESDTTVAYYVNDKRCGTVGDLAFTQLSGVPSDKSGEPGEDVIHNVLITNEGNRDQQFIVTAVDKTWQTQVLNPIIFIPSGTTVTATVRVAVPNDAADGDSDTANIRVTLPDNSNQPPYLPPDTYTTTVTTRVGDAPTVGVSLSSPEQTKFGTGGNTIMFDVMVTNDGEGTDTYTLSVAGAVWTTELSESSVTVNPGASETVQVTVDIPASAESGDDDAVTVSAVSTLDATVTDSLQLLTKVSGDEFIYLPTLSAGD